MSPLPQLCCKCLHPEKYNKKKQPFSCHPSLSPRPNAFHLLSISKVSFCQEYCRWYWMVWGPEVMVTACSLLHEEKLIFFDSGVRGTALVLKNLSGFPHNFEKTWGFFLVIWLSFASAAKGWRPLRRKKETSPSRFAVGAKSHRGTTQNPFFQNFLGSP